ncbi:hypothetical protein DCAR_0311344 [Daucus carota subsp. sativus]|uniref:Uncharacterized protein n=1 Tax=Daucus carota subsp. sativus TaxID=79200 RepID=A0A162AHW0_DAUCS|nr:hypothetical protein DCAR_0311344 [Daucus carota subsp. sativus]
MQNKRKKCATQETTKSADIEKGAGNEDFVMEKIDHPDEKERERLENFRANLIGIGLGKLFMPTPGFKNMDHQHNGTPAADTPPVQEDFDADEENESDEDQPLSIRRSTRLSMKTKFKFTNTPETTINLDAE